MASTDLANSILGVADSWDECPTLREEQALHPKPFSQREKGFNIQSPLPLGEG
ncbi:MAG: hypothetical protein HC812_13055 [Leptolyngbya sp. RL_3_1]|nr:hypothetical protein [Leptolyngbya sp. RL_3_1]